jgi:hypothetical protein
MSQTSSGAIDAVINPPRGKSQRTPPPPANPEVFEILEFCGWARISRTMAFREIAAGRRLCAGLATNRSSRSRARELGSTACRQLGEPRNGLRTRPGRCDGGAGNLVLDFRMNRLAKGQSNAVNYRTRYTRPTHLDDYSRQFHHDEEPARVVVVLPYPPPAAPEPEASSAILMTSSSKIVSTCTGAVAIGLKWTVFYKDGSVAFSVDFYPAHLANIPPNVEFAFDFLDFVAAEPERFTLSVYDMRVY